MESQFAPEKRTDLQRNTSGICAMPCSDAIEKSFGRCLAWFGVILERLTRECRWLEW